MKKKQMLMTLWLLFTLSAVSPGALAAEAGDMLVPVGRVVGIQLDCDGVCGHGSFALSFRT